MTTLTKDTKITLLYIFIAFSFSIAMRLIWMYNFNGYESFMFNGQFMINTNDGYFWAEGARDILSGVSQPNDLSPTTLAPAQLTAFFASIVPFSFESVIFFLPAFLGSLVVIPIILIARVLQNLEMGLIAALLASIAWSYYNRTMIGYYDTDMLNIVLPMFLLWSIIWAVQTKQNIYLLFTAIDILVYRWWYPQSYSLEFAFFGLILLYSLVFDRKSGFNYKLLAIMMIAMMDTDVYLRIVASLGVYYIFTQKQFDKYVYYILAASIGAFLLTGGLDPIWLRLKLYVFTQDMTSSSEGLGLQFYTVMKTVREAGQIPFETFANRISGHTITFLLSVVGYGYLAYKHKIMLLALPLVGLGFLASVAGLRFTIYAVPVLAFGVAFLIVEAAAIMPTKKMKYLSLVAFTLAILYPNVKHIDDYRVPTVFNATEVNVLDIIKKQADREDYVVAWWDYGYPIRYYSDVKTLIDGGKHEGDVNFAVSYVLTNTQEEAAKMARLDVEYTEKNFASPRTGSNIEQMTLDYGFDNSNDFLLSLQTDMKLPKSTRDIYFYLPFKMLSILPTVTLFSNMDLMSGKEHKAPFFFVSRNFKDMGDKINLGRGVFLNKMDSTIQVGQNSMQIKRFVKTSYDANMKLAVDEKLINIASNINVIYMTNYNTFLVLDDKVYNSMYIQLMVLENANKALFEEVVLNPSVKVYKLKY